MHKSDEIGIQAADEMKKFYRLRASYRERPSKRNKIRKEQKARKVSELMRKSLVAYMGEVAV